MNGLNSREIEANAKALRLLAAHGRVRIISEHGTHVRAEWVTR